MPYLKSKMEAAYNAQRGGALQAAFWGTGDVDGVEVESINDDSPSNRDERQGSEATVTQRIKSRISKLCVQMYPWLHASHEGLYIDSITDCNALNSRTSSLPRLKSQRFESRMDQPYSAYSFLSKFGCFLQLS